MAMKKLVMEKGRAMTAMLTVCWCLRRGRRGLDVHVDDGSCLADKTFEISLLVFSHTSIRKMGAEWRTWSQVGPSQVQLKVSQVQYLCYPSRYQAKRSQ